MVLPVCFPLKFPQPPRKGSVQRLLHLGQCMENRIPWKKSWRHTFWKVHPQENQWLQPRNKGLVPDDVPFAFRGKLLQGFMFVRFFSREYLFMLVKCQVTFCENSPSSLNLQFEHPFRYEKHRKTSAKSASFILPIFLHLMTWIHPTKCWWYWKC